MKPTKPPTKAKQGKTAGAPTPRKLNVRMERFCEMVVAGMSGSEAYLKAGWRANNGSERASASKLLAKDNVKQRIAELRKPQTEKAVLTKDLKREILRKIATDPRESTAVRIKAIEVDAKLAGDFAPDKVEFEPGKQLADIMARAANAAAVLSRIGRKTTVHPTTRSGLSRIPRPITGERA